MDIHRHEHEADRLASLASYEVMDTPPNHVFEAITRLAARVCDTPISLISLIGENRQWMLSRVGVDVTEAPRSESVCSDVVAGGTALVIPDLRQVSRYDTLASVNTADGIRAYAGVPVIGRDGLPLGTLCVIDTQPRQFTPDQLEALTDLAEQVVTALELRRGDAVIGLDSPALAADARDPQTVRRALTNNEFVPYFQPVVNLTDGTICGLEALIRWQHPILGLLTPEAFLPALEIGMMADWTGDEILQATCRTLAELRTRGVTLVDGIAINISSRRLTVPGLAQNILSTLARYELPGSALAIELTETAAVRDVAVASAELSILRDAGVRVLADDFGVGWSNLVQLLHLPLTGLKIDKELVSTMAGDRIREQMVASAIQLATTMGLDVIAEGVETEAVRDQLVGMGCTRAQGWLFSQAVPAGDLPALVAMTFPGRSASPVNTGRHSPFQSGPLRGVSTFDILDALSDSTAVVDQWGTILSTNRAWRMFSVDNGGDPFKTGVGVSYHDVCARAADSGSADALDVLRGLRSVLAGETVEYDYEYSCPSSETDRWYSIRITPLRGATRGAVIAHADITRRKLSERVLRHQASHDPLTGLANRLLFTDRLETALSRRRGRDPMPDVGLLYADLDDFKPVNDSYGHSAGDQVLLSVAHRLRSAARPGDTVARLGGDEFAICAPRISARALKSLAERLSVTLAQPHHVHGRQVCVPGSVGAHLAAVGDTVTGALQLADQAMYAVKATRPGRNP
ncbi:MAG: hypothetical protein JWM76_2425 [Pseudonocardiales bacterium]|nr:hypothetical protein [Pseudonocardiales bacterium]